MSDDALFPVPAEPGRPQVVERGEGVSAYRARKPPEALPVKLCGFGEGILVLRCHDLDVADVTVADATETDPAIAALNRQTDRLPGSPIWVRWVPEDPEDMAAGGVYEREERGTIGATPAVLYAHEETRP